MQLLENGRIISWVNIKDRYGFTNDLMTYFFSIKKLYTFGINTVLWSFCKTSKESLIQISCGCFHVKCLQEKFHSVRTVLSCRHIHHRLSFLDYIADQTAILIFESYFINFLIPYKGNINILIAILMKVKKREKQISLHTSNKTEAYKKWCIIDNILPVTYNMLWKAYWVGGKRIFSFFICLYVSFNIFIVEFV